MDLVLEVEKIVNHKINNDTIVFEIKWKGLDSTYNVWLPVKKFPSISLLLHYCNEVNISCIPLPSVKKRANELFQLLGSVSDELLIEFSKRFSTVEAFSLPASNRKNLMKHLMKLIENDDLVDVNYKQLLQLREKVLVEIVIEKRQKQQNQLKEQEWWINTHSDNAEALRLINNRDLAILPTNFTYVNNYIAGPGVEITNFLDETFACVGNHKQCTKDCACMKHFSAKRAYTKDGMNILSRGESVHECNRLCSCGLDCHNRVVQKGCKVKLEIFRTATGTGWGVRTLEYLPKGTFIGRYVGEVITWEMGELLSNSQAEGQYLFDIDFWKGENDHSKYTVDAYKYGNFTRFINHSCVSNLTVFNVWINCLDPSLHDIAFFSTRNIQKGEELTFNYRKLFQKCKCGSYKCVPRKGC